ncbi:MAG: DUF6602 domain-containing protein [Bacillota bacterium]
MTKLNELLRIETEEIQNAFSKASIEGRGTPQEVADRREGFVRSILVKYFPFPNRIAKGNIIDSYGSESPSFDIVMLNSIHPNTISKESERHSVILADGVDFVIDVKGVLMKDELTRSLDQIKKLKQIKRVYDFRMYSKPSEGRLTTLKTIPVILYAASTYKEISDLVEKIVEYYITNNIQRNDQFDCIIINGKYAIFNQYDFCYSSGKDIERHIGVFRYENSMEFLLKYISDIPKATPDLIEPIISRYLKWNNDEYETFPDLNKKLKDANV